MSLYIPSTDEQIIGYKACIVQFERMRGRYYKKRKRNINRHINYQQLTKSINYFNSRIAYYRARIRELEKWRD